MRRFGLRGTIGLAVVFVVATCIAGCFVSKVPLGDESSSKVDLSYVGNWRFANDDGTQTTLVLRNIDDKRYYAEWQGSDKTGRYVGFITDLGGAKFAQLRPLSDDGSFVAEYTIMKVWKESGKLAVRQLDENFFKDKSVGTTEQLRKVVEDNVDNEKMYDAKPMVGTSAPIDAKADVEFIEL
jgi:hypothetical protein